MIEFIRRIRYKILRQIRTYFGLGDPRQTSFFSSQSETAISLLIIAPGEMSIPSAGWGAVETIISETIPHFQQSGFEVTLLNSKRNFIWKQACKSKFDVILCHADSLVPKAREFFPTTPIVAVSHYGFAAYPNRWHKSYISTLEGMKCADAICALSPAIAKAFAEVFEVSKLFIAPNGSSFSPSISNEKSGAFLCVGKVERRKAQFELYSQFRAAGKDIVFFGQIEDERVEKLMHHDQKAKESFRGPRSRLQLQSEISNYRALVLPSLGEADALVLYEAQLAGLPIFVSKEGLGSQDASLEWIRVVTEPFNATIIDNLFSSIKASENEIRQYSTAHYRWDTRLVPLIEMLRKLS